MDVTEKLTAIKTEVNSLRFDLAQLPYDTDAWGMLTQTGQIGTLVRIADALRTASEDLEHAAAAVAWIAPPPKAAV